VRGTAGRLKRHTRPNPRELILAAETGAPAESAITETARVLRPGGVFCFAIVHPFDSACDSGAASAVPFAISRPYLASRRYEDRFDRDGLGITLASMHRPLSAYTTALFRAGLVITDLRDRGDREVPWLLVVRAEKRS